MNPLRIKFGNMPGASFSVRAPSPIVDGELLTWRRVVIRTTGEGGSVRTWIIEPGPGENEVSHKHFFVRGCFNIVAQENNPKRAYDLWNATRAE